MAEISGRLPRAMTEIRVEDCSGNIMVDEGEGSRAHAMG